MKKFFYHFFCYAGLIIAIAFPAQSVEQALPMPFSEEFTQQLEEYKDKSIIETDNELLKLYVTFLLADKLYPEGKINEDMTVFLRRVFPKSDISKLKALAITFKTILMVKRRYVYVIDRLNHKIKADSLLPQDAPIIAKDGEYAPSDQDLHKKSDMNSYQVSYTPYKYIEYDGGELGEPVRRRDKNYEEVNPSVIDELQLALLEFNIGKFYRALQKLPHHNDGSREKTVELENGLKSRLLLGISQPGKLEKITGVIEIYVPKGWYINGDYLNQVSRPKFYLTEDGKDDPNIKEYQVFYPTAAGVTNNGISRRLWYNDVRFPLVFTRRDTNKGINIKSRFTFMLCKAKTDECHLVTSHNSLKLAPSLDDSISIHNNFVNLSFAQVPPEKSRNASLQKAYYDKKNKQLIVKFDTKKTFSNIAVMAEDANGTNFTTPQYTINENEIVATFNEVPTPETINSQLTASSENNRDNNEIAVTAMFDDYETLRTVTTPLPLDIKEDETLPTEPVQPLYPKAFAFGLFLSLMPGVLYLLQRLWQLFITQRQSHKILYRYMASSALAIFIWGTYNHFNPWYTITEHPALLVTILLIVVSFCTGLLGYMDFNLFRPLKKLFPRGIFIGLLSVLMISVMPTPLKTTVMNNISGLTNKQCIISYILIWLGLITIPLAGYLWRQNISNLLSLFKMVNLPYMVIFGAYLLWLLFSINGISALIISLIAATLCVLTWYIYPLAITETTGHKRSLANKTALFIKVQTHCTLIIGMIWLITVLLLTLLTSQKTIPLPNRVELVSQIQQEIGVSPVLVIIAQPQTYYDRKLLNNLKNIGVKILRYDISGYDNNIADWLKSYHKPNPPLNILYNQRHKKGLSLPTSIRGLDWEQTMAEFN